MIKIEQMEFSYNPASTSDGVLKDITLEIPKGSLFAVIGPSGAGKSTLLGLLNGLLRPTSGRIHVQDQEISELKGQALRELRRKVGVVWQFPEQQLFASTVAEDIAFGLAEALTPMERHAAVEQYMSMVGLDLELESRSPFALSGGQQRRVALAGVLAMEPEVLVLDEPTVGLDPMGKRHFLELILRLHQDQGKTIVLVTHDLDMVARSAQVVCLLDQGRVAALGSPQQVFQPEVMEPVGLELPLGPYVIAELNQRNLGSAQLQTGWENQKFIQELLVRGLVRLVGGGADSK